MFRQSRLPGVLIDRGYEVMFRGKGNEARALFQEFRKQHPECAAIIHGGRAHKSDFGVAFKSLSYAALFKLMHVSKKPGA